MRCFETIVVSLVEIGSVTAEILLTLSLCGGWWWWWIKVIFMSHPTFELRLSWGCDNKHIKCRIIRLTDDFGLFKN